MDRYLVLCSYRIRELTDAEKAIKVFLVCVHIIHYMYVYIGNWDYDTIQVVSMGKTTPT